MMVNRVEVQRIGPLYRQIKDLPKDVLLMIFERLSEADLVRSRRVCRQWNVIGQDERVMRKFEYAFGVRCWYRHFGQVGVEPPLPQDIEAIMNSPCPFWSGKKVYETHLLVLIPEKVNGKPFTLDSLGEMIKKPKQGCATQFEANKVKKEHGNRAVPRGYWVLMTRDVLPGSRNKAYSEQKEQVKQYRNYEVPRLLEVAASVLMEHVRTGKRLYSDNPNTYTRCQEQIFGYPLVAGGFSSGGFGIYHSLHVYVDQYSGVSAARKFLGD